MSYKQLKDIVKQARRLKNRVEKLCEQRRQETDDDMFEELLQRVSQYEQRMKVHLEKYGDQAAEGILETWIQFSGNEELERALHNLSESENVSDEEVVQKVLAADAAYVQILRLAAAQVQARRVREFFEALLELEDHKTRAIGRELNEMQDLGDYQ